MISRKLHDIMMFAMQGFVRFGLGVCELFIGTHS